MSPCLFIDGWWTCGPRIDPKDVCGVCKRQWSVALCDFPVRGRTCDLPLCDNHRRKQGGETLDMDFCPAHQLIALGLVSA